MSEQQIRVGQIWQSRDKRDLGATRTVVALDGDVVRGSGFVVTESVIKSRMRAHTLRTRYRLVRDVTPDH